MGDYRSICCLICNYISKIDEGLQNEFIRLRFNQLPKNDIIQFLIKKVINADISDDVRFRALDILYQSFIIISDEIESELQIVACLGRLCK